MSASVQPFDFHELEKIISLPIQKLHWFLLLFPDENKLGLLWRRGKKFGRGENETLVGFLRGSRIDYFELGLPINPMSDDFPLGQVDDFLGDVGGVVGNTL